MEESSSRTFELVKIFKELMVSFKQYMKKAYEEMGMEGFTTPQGFIIGILSKKGKMKVHELSEKLNMTNSTVSGVIDRLEKQGIVERTRCQDDKRVVFVNLSGQFESTHQNFHEKMDQNIENIMKKGTPEELEQITKGLSTLKKLLDQTQK